MEIVIYTKTGCPYCRKVIEQYRQDGITFREVNLSDDPQALKMVKEEYSAIKVPVIVKDGKLIEIGFKGFG